MTDFPTLVIALACAATLAVFLYLPGRTRAAIAAGAAAVLGVVVGVAWRRHREVGERDARVEGEVDAVLVAIEDDGEPVRKANSSADASADDIMAAIERGELDGALSADPSFRLDADSEAAARASKILNERI